MTNYAAEKPSNLIKVSIIIPTRDSAGHIAQILTWYRKHRFEPTFVLDGRSKDNTEQLLINMQARYTLFTPEFNFSEDGMLEAGCNACDTDWIFRIDDDELPSKNMIEWLKGQNFDAKQDCWGITRKDITRIKNDYYYSRWPTRLCIREDCVTFNTQYRLFRKKSVTFVKKLHTPGYEIPKNVRFAPPECYFIHFNNIIRDSSARFSKVLYYSKFDPYNAWSLVDECLPEITNIDNHRFANEGLDQFREVLDSICIVNEWVAPSIPNCDLIKIQMCQQDWLVRSLLQTQTELLEHKKALNNKLIYFPCCIIKSFSEMILTISKFLKNDNLNAYGAMLWKLHKLKKSLIVEDKSYFN